MIVKVSENMAAEVHYFQQAASWRCTFGQFNKLSIRVRELCDDCEGGKSNAIIYK